MEIWWLHSSRMWKPRHLWWLSDLEAVHALAAFERPGSDFQPFSERPKTSARKLQEVLPLTGSDVHLAQPLQQHAPQYPHDLI